MNDTKVDEMLAWLRERRALTGIGAQDQDVGFPTTAPPGYWVEVKVDGGRVSIIDPSFSSALARAIETVKAAGVTGH